MSPQAEIFRRRHTQHNSSVELGAHSAPHTTHFLCPGFARSVVIARLACSRISLGTTGSSRAGFFGFIWLSRKPLDLYYTPCTPAERKYKKYYAARLRLGTQAVQRVPLRQAPARPLDEPSM